MGLLPALYGGYGRLVYGEFSLVFLSMFALDNGLERLTRVWFIQDRVRVIQFRQEHKNLPGIKNGKALLNNFIRQHIN